MHQNPVEGLLKCNAVPPDWSFGLRKAVVGPGICISDKCRGGAAAAGPGTTLETAGLGRATQTILI